MLQLENEEALVLRERQSVRDFVVEEDKRIDDKFIVEEDERADNKFVAEEVERVEEVERGEEVEPAQARDEEKSVPRGEIPSAEVMSATAEKDHLQKDRPHASFEKPFNMGSEGRDYSSNFPQFTSHVNGPLTAERTDSRKLEGGIPSISAATAKKAGPRQIHSGIQTGVFTPCFPLRTATVHGEDVEAHPQQTTPSAADSPLPNLGTQNTVRSPIEELGPQPVSTLRSPHKQCGCSPLLRGVSDAGNSGQRPTMDSVSHPFQSDARTKGCIEGREQLCETALCFCGNDVGIIGEKFFSQEGRSEIDEGNKTTPSYVAFTYTERLIGDAAKNQVSIDPTHNVFDAKRSIRRHLTNEEADDIGTVAVDGRGQRELRMELLNGLPATQFQIAVRHGKSTQTGHDMASTDVDSLLAMFESNKYCLLHADRISHGIQSDRDSFKGIPGSIGTQGLSDCSLHGPGGSIPSIFGAENHVKTCEANSKLKSQGLCNDLEEILGRGEELWRPFDENNDYPKHAMRNNEVDILSRADEVRGSHALPLEMHCDVDSVHKNLISAAYDGQGDVNSQYTKDSLFGTQRKTFNPMRACVDGSKIDQHFEQIYNANRAVSLNGENTARFRAANSLSWQSLAISLPPTNTQGFYHLLDRVSAKQKIESAVDKAVGWMDNNQVSEMEEFEDKLDNKSDGLIWSSTSNIDYSRLSKEKFINLLECCQPQEFENYSRPLKGSWVLLVIDLRTSVFAKDVTLQHVVKTNVYDSLSPPKLVCIFGWFGRLESKNEEASQLGEFTHDLLRSTGESCVKDYSDDGGKYFESAESSVFDYRLMGKFVPEFFIREYIFYSDLMWRRLIRSVLEQSLAKLRSSQALAVL